MRPIRYNDHNMKNGPVDILIGVVIGYVFLGISVVAVQELSGSKCGPITLGGDYVYEVNQDASRFWIWRIFQWLPTAYDNVFQEDVYEMNPNYIYIIAPFTSFSSRFTKKHVYDSGIHVSGRHLTETINESDFEEKSLFHFFTHFNLGVPFDNVYPGIYKIELTNHLKERLNYLTQRLKIENKDFKLTFNLKLQSFIKEAISNIGSELWKVINIDDRVLTVLRYSAE